MDQIDKSEQPEVGQDNFFELKALPPAYGRDRKQAAPEPGRQRRHAKNSWRKMTASIFRHEFFVYSGRTSNQTGI
jgi:hypothetical protein